MAIITKITAQQKNTERFNVFVDYGKGKGEEFAYSVDGDVLIKFQLKKGMELDDFSSLEIQYQDSIRKAYNLAVNYLSWRMRSEKEVKDYLVKKEMDEPIINEILHRLSTQKYINDEDFAIAFVRTQVNSTDKGPNEIKRELREKGIAEGIQIKVLKEFPLEQQIERATKISEKFFQKNTKESGKVLKQKLENLLLRKGYSFEVISIAVNETFVTNEPDEDMEAIRYQGEKADRKFSQYSGYEYNQKMKQTLFRKGFSIEIIEKFLAEIEKS
jgi:regulatory protein